VRHAGEPRLGRRFGRLDYKRCQPRCDALGFGFVFYWHGHLDIDSDKIEKEETQVAQKLGVFGATLVTFFLAEMGDKTQIATVALAAHYGAPLLVVIGTTLGMLIADIPAVFVGNKFAEKIPMKLVHAIAAGIFAVMGLLTLLKVEKLLQ
jgi:putative Ca2+/H+ antiporter (TMEM165/GDT1 family)